MMSGTGMGGGVGGLQKSDQILNVFQRYSRQPDRSAIKELTDNVNSQCLLDQCLFIPIYCTLFHSNRALNDTIQSSVISHLPAPFPSWQLPKFPSSSKFIKSLGPGVATNTGSL